MEDMDRQILADSSISNPTTNLNIELALGSTATPSSILERISAFVQIFYFPLNSFYLPLLILLCSINGPLCLSIFFFSREFYNTTAKVHIPLRNST